MTKWQDRFKVVPAVYVLLEKEGKILLIRRAGTGYMDGFYSLPAGHLDGGEAATSAAVREAKEEVGVTIQPECLEMVHVVHRRALEGDHERIDIFFKASEYAGQPQIMEADKCDELLWASLDALPEKMIPEVQHVLACIQRGQAYSEFNFSE